MMTGTDGPPQVLQVDSPLHLNRLTMRSTLALLAASLFVAAPIAAQQTAAAGPKVGDLAPDFTIKVAGKDGVKSAPFKLSDARGSTVVIAFFPKARTSGCTIQMEAYRDRYAGLFMNGKKVIVLGISVDADTTLAAWAAEKNLPFNLGSDVGGTVGTAYGAFMPGPKMENRLLFVVGPDGRIAYDARPFRVTAEDAYQGLGDAVTKAQAGTR